jgi:hypothetical protein
MSDKKKDPPVIHVKIKVKKEVNPSTGELEFVPTYEPEVIPVTEPDTILNFKLDSKSEEDVYIDSVKYNPEDNDQLSSPSISQKKNQVTLSDINTIAETIYLKFTYKAKKKSDTDARIGACGESDSDEYPQIINEPPP